MLLDDADADFVESFTARQYNSLMCLYDEYLTRPIEGCPPERVPVLSHQLTRYTSRLYDRVLSICSVSSSLILIFQTGNHVVKLFKK